MNKRKVLSVCMILILSISIIGFGDDHVKKIEAYLSNDLNFNVDGEKWQPKDVDGSDLTPILYNDRTYVPVRSLLEDKGVTVGYEAETKTVLLDYSTMESTKEFDKSSPILYKTLAVEGGGGGAGKVKFEELSIIKNPDFNMPAMESKQEITFDLDSDADIILDGREVESSIDELVEKGITWNLNSANLIINKETGSVEKINITSPNADKPAAIDVDVKLEITCCPLKATLTINF